MDIDPDDVFRDDEDDLENELHLQGDANKEYVVYLIDASPNMFNFSSTEFEQIEESHFRIAVSCITQALKTRIINRSFDEVAICFFNTREKMNLQDLNGVYVYNVPERESLDQTTAKLIKEFGSIENSFMVNIGSKQIIEPGSRENSLYNAIWVAQGLLRKGSAKTSDKRILIFTNEDDPFGHIKGAAKADMTRTTLQRAKDAQDLGITIDLLPLNPVNKEFDVSIFYADLIGLDKDEIKQFIPLAGEKLEDIKDQLRKRISVKRIVRRITLELPNSFSIDLNSYALYRPTLPGTITWLDSVTNRPLKAERSFICSDTGALMQDSNILRYQPYKNENITFTVEELSQIKNLSIGKLRLIGFKPLSCLKDYHNLRPSTFLFPFEKEVSGSTCVFIALLRSMLKLKRFGVAFYGTSTNPRLVALLPQEEIEVPGGQIEPPGMHMIYLPYSDDIRNAEELHSNPNVSVPRANNEQIEKASAVIKRVTLEDFSVCQFSNPALQRHYAVLEALALDEDDLPEIKDETLPDEEGLSRPGVAKTIEELKRSVFGDTYDEEDEEKKPSEASKKRKAIADDAAAKSTNYNWDELAETGKLKDLTVVELKYYLAAHNLPQAGKKDVLVSRILDHIAK